MAGKEGHWGGKGGGHTKDGREGELSIERGVDSE